MKPIGISGGNALHEAQRRCRPHNSGEAPARRCKEFAEFVRRPLPSSREKHHHEIHELCGRKTIVVRHHAVHHEKPAFTTDAYLNNRDYESAARWAHKAIERRRDFPHPHMTLASAMGHLGEVDAAAKALTQCKDLHTDYLGQHPLLEVYKNPSDRLHYLAGLTAAGMKLPDARKPD